MRRKIQGENFWKYYLDPEKEDKKSATEFVKKAGIKVEEEKSKLINLINKKEEEIDYRSNEIPVKYF